MNHSENLKGMAEFPNDVTADYLLDMASSMQHYEKRIAELEAELDQCLTVHAELNDEHEKLKTKNIGLKRSLQYSSESR